MAGKTTQHLSLIIPPRVVDISWRSPHSYPCFLCDRGLQELIKSQSTSRGHQ
ncbi:MAG TPA: hypothetical protein IGS40_14135 [Trichormus sp. M33_DOE_039]|nr:hypothetical protein [Trichormus sp. M33_DOE_039]